MDFAGYTFQEVRSNMWDHDDSSFQEYTCKPKVSREKGK